MQHIDIKCEKKLWVNERAMADRLLVQCTCVQFGANLCATSIDIHPLLRLGRVLEEME